jgi:hypothetical protein
MRGWPIIGAAVLAGAWASQPLAARPPNLAGDWGGEHAGITFQGGLGDVRFDCASGTIDVPVLPAKDGSFEARGTYRAGQPGPVRVGRIFVSQPATYAGKLEKKALTLIVTLEDGTELGPFTLAPGAAPQLRRCL